MSDLNLSVKGCHQPACTQGTDRKCAGSGSALLSGGWGRLWGQICRVPILLPESICRPKPSPAIGAGGWRLPGAPLPEGGSSVDLEGRGPGYQVIGKDIGEGMREEMAEAKGRGYGPRCQWLRGAAL